MRNLREYGFSGPIYPVNPKYEVIDGVPAYPDATRLPEAPDLAVVATPPKTVPAIIADFGARGTKAAIVLSAGITDARRFWRKSLKAKMLESARPHLMRILGPDSLGLLVPSLNLNASGARTAALSGRLAFVSQSGAMGEAVLDWAHSRGIGFSKFISVGDAVDIDFGDLLDYLASDFHTNAILLFIASVSDARKFMSAARAAARNKPVVVVKAGRAPEGARAVSLHTGMLAAPDDVFDAAIRRAGMLRVFSTEELFDAVESLARARPMAGDRLAIMSNGGGPGIMATDALSLRGGRLAGLSAATQDKLKGMVLPYVTVNNPLDILSYAPARNYAEVLQTLTEDPEADAVLVIHAPNSLVAGTDVVASIAPVAAKTRRNVLACWLGGDAVAEARELSVQAGIPTYDTPEKAVGAFLQIVEHRRNQELLIQVPASVPQEFEPDTTLARALVRSALARGREMLSEPEAKSVLLAYGVPVVTTHIAHSGRRAVEIAMGLGFPVAIKIVSDQVAHKSDVGGVALEIESPEEVRGAVRALRKRLRTLRPEAKLRGFAVQKMANRASAQELIIGAATDPVFGPVIVFGQGGTSVALTADRAIGLPPLNMVLARDLVMRTKIARLLAGYSDHPRADVDALCLTLIKVSQMITDVPEIVELDINPLLADDQGVIALDARMRVATPKGPGADRLAIRPYPKELEEWIDWEGRRVLLRPIRPEDGEAHRRFFASLDPEDVRMRLFVHMRELKPSQLARMTQIDYDREMAIIATASGENGERETLGVVRVVVDPENIDAEFAATVRSDLKGKGLGIILMRKIIDYCRARGTARIIGETLYDNIRLQRLAKRFGFTFKPSEEPGVVRLELELKPAKT